MNKWTDPEQYKKIFRFIGKRSMRYLILGVLTGIALSIVEVTFAYLLQAFLVVLKVVPSRTFMNVPSWLPIDNPLAFLLFVAIVLLAKGLIQWGHSFLLAATYEVQRQTQRYRLIDWAFHSKSVNSAEVLQLYHNGIDSTCSTLSNVQGIAIILSTSLLIFAYLLKISVLITFISFGILALLALLMKFFDTIIADSSKTIDHEQLNINRSLLSHFKNLLLLQIYGTQDQENKLIRSKIKKVTFHSLRYSKILNLKSTLPPTFGKILICSLCVVSTRRSWIPSGLMITYFYLFLQFVQNFSEVVRVSSQIVFSWPPTAKFAIWWADHSYDGVRNKLDLNKNDKKPPLLEPLGWKIDHVTFTYSDTQEPVLNDFSLTVPPKSCTVLVGESGSGKSTILALALGLIDANQGSVNVMSEEIGEKSIDEIRERLLSSIGYVGPESFLIEGTVYENLLYGLHRIPTESEVKDVIQIADCHFIDAFPKKLEHYITEQGQGLSAGQKQRLSFARALLRKPKLLILDEATSNLDMETEEKFVGTLEKMKGKVTILAVTHRVALLRIADQVINLNPN